MELRREDVPSYWLHEAGASPSDPLEGDREADFCVVGAGLTGLWTAYYLSVAEPDARIAVIEKRMAGYGASGRNAGWLSSEFDGKLEDMARRGGRAGVVAMHHAMNETFDLVVRTLRDEGVDAGLHHGGIIRFAQNPAQLVRVRAYFEKRRSWGVDAGYSWLSGEEVAERVRVHGVLGGYRNEYGARVQPAKLVRGLLEVVRRRGVRVHEDTEALRIEPGRVVTSRGAVRAPVVIRSVEAYLVNLPGHRRDVLPMQSTVILTDPIPESRRAEIGWSGAELIADGANAYAAAQLTADWRIVMGARGILPKYGYGSALDHDGRTTEAARRHLFEAVTNWFPQLRDLGITDSWCGVLAIPRDWTPSVNFDPATGLASAGGYVGSGVSTTNLAGRTLADLVRGRKSDLTELPWVNRPTRRWEPEPLRWVGVNAMTKLYRAADRREQAGTERPSRLSRIGAFVTGR
ncbi:FAD-dependent oxidoreductase [Acrocarpospora phusangensis]|uniref:FAD-dependent oxidoreductase n=1 Tax=Acrocarpospora phusangensis TaxID=1070424 RepID=A0A919Q8C3_9ACTN|nr:FAD-binding oxidoreductase [Acrocarpospora phusangensis]GIH23406.1 FAD-dependent oxidoreductase [Acrocarpospora phusangensis]